MVQELDPRKALEPLRRALKIWEGQTPPDLCRLAREHFTITSALEGIRPQTAEEVQLAYADQLAGLGRILQVDCSGLPRGLYFLRLSLEGESAAQRVTVVR